MREDDIRAWLEGDTEAGESVEKWVDEIRLNCLASDTAFFFKQWGGLRPKSNGRLLDGRTWDQYPRSSIATASA